MGPKRRGESCDLENESFIEDLSRIQSFFGTESEALASFHLRYSANLRDSSKISLLEGEKVVI